MTAFSKVKRIRKYVRKRKQKPTFTGYILVNYLASIVVNFKQDKKQDCLKKSDVISLG